MSPPPQIVLRLRRKITVITGHRHLIQVLVAAGPKPPPHPMILGTLTGYTLRSLRAVHLIGKELLIPAPHQIWRDLEPERWPHLWRTAIEMAHNLETLCHTSSRPADIGVVTAV